jgi:hypothetical protein
MISWMRGVQVGLVDGTGNLKGIVIGAVNTLYQLSVARSLLPKDRTTYPQPGM